MKSKVKCCSIRNLSRFHPASRPQQLQRFHRSCFDLMSTSIEYVCFRELKIAQYLRHNNLFHRNEKRSSNLKNKIRNKLNFIRQFEEHGESFADEMSRLQNSRTKF